MRVPAPLVSDQIIASPHIPLTDTGRVSVLYLNITSTTSFDLNEPVKMPSSKAMLATALAKANTAVQLDNTHSYIFARKYYQESCVLLSQLVNRASKEKDREKLKAIRHTYLQRIEQLGGLGPEEA
ncbi:hypothetical protein F4781DRAFT_427513 [Annulohypoxylon bovei var. microspora]|nr:hypothetical protein F4781DRAFT_427513 [Annulohypoxylon bovei var. microspora]